MAEEPGNFNKIAYAVWQKKDNIFKANEMGENRRQFRINLTRK